MTLRTMSDLEAATVRVSIALKPSIELDEDIRQAVGAESIDYGDGCQGPPAYTSSIDAALTLLDYLVMPVFEIRHWYAGMGDWRAEAHAGPLQTGSPAEHYTPALAICLAALKAIQRQRATVTSTPSNRI